MMAAAEIARATGLFRVPRIVDVDEQNRRIDIEYIEEFRSVSALKLTPDATAELLYRVGLVLRTIHQGHWSPGTKSALPLFHGDYDLHNVGVDGAGQLVVLDWDSAPELADVPLSDQQRDIGLLQFSIVTSYVRRAYLFGRIRVFLLSALRGYLDDDPDGGALQEHIAHGKAVTTHLARPSCLPRVSVARKSYLYAIRFTAMGLMNLAHATARVVR